MLAAPIAVRNWNYVVKVMAKFSYVNVGHREKLSAFEARRKKEAVAKLTNVRVKSI